MLYTKDNITLSNAIMLAIKETLSNTHTTLIAKITKVNQSTINCLPVVSRSVNNTKVDLPEFAEVPVLNFLGGGSSIQMPISVGDYCVLFVSERSIDNWYFGYDFQESAQRRMFDYSDSIAFVGLKNNLGALDIPSIMTMIGDCNQTGNYEHTGDRTQTGNYTLDGNQEINGNLIVNGNLTCTGTISAGNFTGLGGGALITSVNIETTADIIAGSISLKNHTHTANGEETSTAN